MPALRHLLLCLLVVCATAGASPFTVDTVPNVRLATGSHVADPDGIIGATATAGIDQQLIALERDTGAQVAVVAVDSIGDADVFGFAQALFEHWGIGGKARDDGLLILLVKDKRTVRLHTGYGLEGALPDVVCKRIEREDMVPAFREGRFGDGLVAGVQAVDRILRDPAQAQAVVAVAASATDEVWSFIKVVGGIFGGIVVLFVFIFKAAAGDFSARQRGTPRAMRWTAWQWLAVFVGAPVLLAAGFDQIVAAPRSLGYLATLYGFYMLVALHQAWRQQRTLTALAGDGSFRDIDALIDSRLTFWLWMGLLFPVPFLVHYFFQRGRRSHYRNYPRQCPKCKAPMRRLGEDEEDAYLSKGQQAEEKLHAADYDVWRCTACEATINVAFPGTDARYQKCPKCKCLAYLEESDRTLVAPSYARSGKGERVDVCQFCGYRAVTAYAIAKLVESASSSSSSSSGSSSSGGGSDWGGGSSGGGGASSSW
jgi:uncharacterized protein